MRRSLGTDLRAVAMVRPLKRNQRRKRTMKRKRDGRRSLRNGRRRIMRTSP